MTNTVHDPSTTFTAVAYHLIKPGGSIRAIEGSTSGMEHRRTGLTLAQAPGAVKAFATGRKRRLIEPFNLTVHLEADNLAAAEAAFDELVTFARNSIYLARYAPGLIEGADYIASRALAGDGKSVARVNPRAIQASHQAWRFHLDLWPRYVHGTTIEVALATEDEDTLTTEDGSAIFRG